MNKVPAGRPLYGLTLGRVGPIDLSKQGEATWNQMSGSKTNRLWDWLLHMAFLWDANPFPDVQKGTPILICVRVEAGFRLAILYDALTL